MRKKLTIIFMLIVVISSGIMQKVFAINEPYDINRVMINIYLTEDGDAEIIEAWEITSELEDILVTNRAAVIQQEANIQPSISSKFEYNQQVVRLSYCLENAVSLIEETNSYTFGYQVILKDLNYNIKKFHIRMTFENENIKPYLIAKTSGTYNVSKFFTSINAENVSDKYMFEIKLVEEIGSIGAENAGLIKTCILILIMIISLIMLWYRIISGSSQQLKKHANLLIDNFKEYVPQHFTPAEFICVAFKQNAIPYSYLKLMIFLAELANNGVIFFDDNYKHILYPTQHSLNGNTAEILKLLDNCREYTVQQNAQCTIESNYWKLPIGCLKKYSTTMVGFYQINDTLNKVTPRGLLSGSLWFHKYMLALTDSMPIISFDELVREYHHNPIVALYYYNNQYQILKNDDVEKDELTYFMAKWNIILLKRTRYFKDYKNVNIFKTH